MEEGGRTAAASAQEEGEAGTLELHGGTPAAAVSPLSPPSRIGSRMADDDVHGCGPAAIELCRDGPLLVRGDVALVSPSGAPIPRHRRTIGLCRCGSSAIKPYCDGSHKVVGFTTDDEPAAVEE